MELHVGIHDGWAVNRGGDRDICAAVGRLTFAARATTWGPEIGERQHTDLLPLWEKTPSAAIRSFASWRSVRHTAA